MSRPRSARSSGEKFAAAAKAVRAAHPRPEQLLEEIAEARAAKFKVLARHALPAAKRLAAAKTAGTGRRTEFRAGFPVRAQFVVFFALVRVAEDFVGLVDLLEFFLGLLFVLGDIGMKFTRQLAKSFFDLVLARRARHAEALVIIFVLNGHRPGKNVPMTGALSKPGQ